MYTLATLPGDDIRSIMWRFADRFELQMLVQSVRAVARGPVARAVAEGARNSHEWTTQKSELLNAFDESGITAVFMDPEFGGFIEGPKNFALALTAYELSWVDAGAATGSLAGNLALEPIHERGTEEQKRTYMGGAVPLQPGDDRIQYRGAFGLTEPLPYVGVETGMLGGKVRVADWPADAEPVLQVEKRGRFITNMDFANFVCVAVESDDDRIKGSCMIILEETDPGTFDRGAPTLKLVHQLSSTRDPVFNMKVPASRIIGGYTVKDGVILPNFSHAEIIDPVFKHTRVTVGLMTAAKLVSAVEPVIRYQRGRFRGGSLEPESPRYKLGIQQKEDALHRIAAVWAMGEAASSLGFAAARLFDELDPMEKEKEKHFREQGIDKGRAEFKALMNIQTDAVEHLENNGDTPSDDPMIQYVITDSLANVLCPATKLWNTGEGATAMREAVSLMGGYGITEDCPGFLGQKWMDSQLEATYEGPEAVQRRQLSITMTNKVFLTQFGNWMQRLENLALTHDNMGMSALVSGMRIWLETLDYLQTHRDENNTKLYSSSRQAVTFAMADALCWLLASYYQMDDVLQLMQKGPENAAVAPNLEGYVAFFKDLCFIQASRAAHAAAQICSELYYGSASTLPESGDILTPLLQQLNANIAGVHPARDRAAEALTTVMIPEALDYPQ